MAALRDCSKDAVGEGQYIRFRWRGCSCNQALTLKEIFCESQGEGVTMKAFSAFLDLKRRKDWDCEISS